MVPKNLKGKYILRVCMTSLNQFLAMQVLSLLGCYVGFSTVIATFMEHMLRFLMFYTADKNIQKFYKHSICYQP